MNFLKRRILRILYTQLLDSTINIICVIFLSVVEFMYS